MGNIWKLNGIQDSNQLQIKTIKLIGVCDCTVVHSTGQWAP